ncbi:MAG: TerB family tellurite resistance protein [Deltaproteobacteria bacterium]|nr:TerB family tellurite resistance protein [Deltaproteobacteria bacterium]
MLQDLTSQERMQLMKFICSFAWADLQIHPHEREFITRMVRRLELDREERHQVDHWLEVPPHPHEVDPTLIPLEHRKTFVESIVGLIESDGVVTEEERENLALFEHLLR